MRTVLDYLDKTAAAFPEKVSFRDEKTALTFAQLKEQAVRGGSALLKEVGVVIDVHHEPTRLLDVGSSNHRPIVLRNHLGVLTKNLRDVVPHLPQGCAKGVIRHPVGHPRLSAMKSLVVCHSAASICRDADAFMLLVVSHQPGDGRFLYELPFHFFISSLSIFL